MFRVTASYLSLQRIARHLPLVAVLTSLVSLPAGGLAQNSQNTAWGTASAGSASFSHINDANAAIIAAQGRNSLLSDVTVNSIGVFNQISVVGDDNLLTSTQEGENNGELDASVSVDIQQ